MMNEEYSIEICSQLKEKFQQQNLYRPMRIKRYDPGTVMNLDIEDITTAATGKVVIKIEAYVGGGFAGQVYRVKLQQVDAGLIHEEGLQAGSVYALKIFIPPSGFSRIFRNFIYWLGFQAPFQMQVNVHAARAGALWQKFIRRGARIKFGSETGVNNVFAIFRNEQMKSYGEISTWIEGRTWKLEVDDHLDLLKRYLRHKPVDTGQLGSPEYRAKKEFMSKFVTMLHQMGGAEFARQYEWATCKSQPNCLKQISSDPNPQKGLVAVDFRAGLALLPFLPMSPGDFKLIFAGFRRLSLVQFDRGNIKQLEQFISGHSEKFTDMEAMLVRLKESERIYRTSQIDISHNHFKLLFSKKLWSGIVASARSAWKIRNLIDKNCEIRLKKNWPLQFFFYIVGIIPILGNFIRKIFGHQGWRRHYGRLLSSWSYLRRAWRAKVAEKITVWHRNGRLSEKKALRLANASWRYLAHLPLSILPGGLHRFFSDWTYAKQKLHHILVRPIKLYFNADSREQWLKDMVAEGQKKQMLTPEDASIIHNQIKEPFIQKYLKSLAVHVCTLPVTQIVSLLVSWIYVTMHPELTTAQAAAAVGAILILFQITPVSPGSLVRGFYVLALVIRERNFKDYNIAVFLGFFKYIGYLAFPIQMTYRYPTLARFMAGHWATEAVHIIPVFGERGALLEHWVFRLFYNLPLTIRRRMQKIALNRQNQSARYWHLVPLTLVGAAILTIADRLFYKNTLLIPTLKDNWWLIILAMVVGGRLVTRLCGGASLAKRIISAVVFGTMAALVYSAITLLLPLVESMTFEGHLPTFLWHFFLFTLLSTISAIITEIKKQDPDIK